MNLGLTTNISESIRMEGAFHYFATFYFKKASSVVITEIL